MDLLNFMYSNSLTRTTPSTLLDVFMAADKYEVASCMRYCSRLLRNLPMTCESALLYLDLPSTVLMADTVHPLTYVVKKFLAERFTDMNKAFWSCTSLIWNKKGAFDHGQHSVDVKKNVIVTVSSDKGLCGGINSTSVKISRGLYKINSGPEKESKYVTLGEKAKAQLVRDSKKNIALSLTELQKNPLNYTQKKEACWTILNITAGNKEQIQNWRFGSWPDGIVSKVHLTFEELESGVTIVKAYTHRYTRGR